ncbi:Calcineurin-like phosphoesterase [Roseovarius nanhaiticus]|uniref:Calcineurin-like phosphoesterase n=1 Tax=Roseovarius nanhaiticus TaxID=573024 RepID=A0A1N7GXD3_9RHOB|nr:phosphodiesterase [Roseovarius nanhaiticus]SEL20857.1 Calcineurin-like phosphoesterase [Roseovarius nanhaiticus]SIS17200.1 Calcineurin-like phosphoesterase [Roseovarius nanhaiticus]
MTTILQITDTHIVSEGQLVSGRLDTAPPLARLVQRIAEILPAIGPVDALLITGDLSDDGSAESYARLRAMLAPLDLRAYVIPGNHDLRDPMRAAFAADGYLPRSGPLDWSVRLGDIQFIGLDTLVEGQGGGALMPASLGFLDRALSEGKGRPTLVALHHPPFDSGISFMDRIGLSDKTALANVLAAHEGDIRLVCGHIHSVMIGAVGGKIAISGPSPCSGFAYDRRAEAPVGYHAREDGLMVHSWDGGFRSVHVPMAPGAGPFGF